ncbi:MAG: hypothetical protein IJC43_06900 [Clostridia bacterium]|nr:hypothetical protein [Clostridia bacterium]
MEKKYFRKKDPATFETTKEWVEMTGREFYAFVTAPENKSRRFMDLGDVVLECTEEQYRANRTEADHHRYLREQETKWTLVSLEHYMEQHGHLSKPFCEEDAQKVESEVLKRLAIESLHRAISLLDERDRTVVEGLYLTDPPKTLRQLSVELGVSTMTVQRRKERILQTLLEQLSEKEL